jgi:hypothetical protein
MGRLGLSILKKKDKNRSAEGAAAAFAHRPESAEVAELNEFVQAIQEKNDTIRSVSSALVLFPTFASLAT